MISKNFRLAIVIRVLVIVGLSLLLAFVITYKPSLFIPVAIVVALIICSFDLIRYIEKSNKDLTHFLLSIRQGAFTESYTSGSRGKPHRELSAALNEVIGEFAKLNEEKEVHFQYLQALNENINVAILSFDAEGKLIMMNPSAKKLLKNPFLSNIESFKNIDNNLYNTIKTIRPDQRVVTRVFIGEEIYQLNVQVKDIMLKGNPCRIILLQNLNSELEANEIEAWHQLMRVLTHEIMNSVTPILSLTQAAQLILTSHDGTRKELQKLNEENIEDIFQSLTTISSRSKSLISFVKAFKDYAKPMEIHFESTDIIDLIHRVENLLKPELKNLSIAFQSKHVNKVIVAKVDPVLLEQVLINLITNAMEAVPNDGTGNIVVTTKIKNDTTVSITVSDNGTGIDQETLPKIFIPFFTTKTNGSGIGLSLSRQIMKLHNGTIKVQSSARGSNFILEWS